MHKYGKVIQYYQCLLNQKLFEYNMFMLIGGLISYLAVLKWLPY